MEVSVWLAGITQLSGFFGASWKVSEKLVCGLQEASGPGQGFQYPLPWVAGSGVGGGWLRKGGIHNDVCIRASPMRLKWIHTIPAPGPDPELLVLRVLVDEEGPDPELLALRCLVKVSCCWSGTASLYRPGILLDSRPIWNGEFSLVGESPTIREGGYTAVRMVDVGSLVSGIGWVAPVGTAGTAER